MTTGVDVLNQARRLARSSGSAVAFSGSTSDILTRHALESFLERLGRTPHAGSFVLKGGLAVSVYNVRRPTKDIDSALVNADLDAEYLRVVVNDVVDLSADDGVDLDVGSLDIQAIRDGAEYPGIRVRVRGSVGSARVGVVWDVSTGDPITPAPRSITIPRALGGEITLLGYSPETIIAEKSVTILERGITSTRWRDYIDIVELFAGNDIDFEQLRSAVDAVADHRRVELGPTAAVLDGYGAVAQPKWAAWRRKYGLEAISEELLDEQMARVSAIVDPIFTRR